MNPKAYFEMLIDWKKLPAYRLEPRIDSLVGYYLPGVLRDFLHEEIVGIIPEFPLRKATINPLRYKERHSEESYKVDFYALVSTGTNYFIEMKSDSGSRRDNQDDYLQMSVERGMKAIVDGILSIAGASNYKKKYNYLKSKLRGLKILDESGEFIGSNDEIKVIYVQPKLLKQDESHVIIDFLYIAKWLNENYPDDQFAKSLSLALKQWAND